MLSPEQKHRLRKTFATVERQSHVAALVFYQRLFELAPETRALFGNDMDAQAQKVMHMFGIAVGTFSSIYIAGPVLILFRLRPDRYRLRGPGNPSAKA